MVRFQSAGHPQLVEVDEVRSVDELGDQARPHWSLSCRLGEPLRCSALGFPKDLAVVVARDQTLACRSDHRMVAAVSYRLEAHGYHSKILSKSWLRALRAQLSSKIP